MGRTNLKNPIVVFPPMKTLSATHLADPGLIWFCKIGFDFGHFWHFCRIQKKRLGFFRRQNNEQYVF